MSDSIVDSFLYVVSGSTRHETGKVVWIRNCLYQYNWSLLEADLFVGAASRHAYQ